MAQALWQASGLAFLYIALVFLLPASQATVRAYHLSSWQYHVILFAASLPTVVAWLAAFIGYARLREYVAFIHNTPEGIHFDKLSAGAAWLAWSLPIPAFVALLLGAVGNQWPSLYGATIIIDNYVNLLLPLVAFSLIGTASRGLLRRAKLSLSVASVRAIMLLFLLFGVLYCYLTFQNFGQTTLTSTANPYFLPIWLMVLSVMIPYLYAWFIGALAAYEITLFSRQTSGILYRQALGLLVLGLTVIILSSIAVQYTGSLQPRVGHLVFGYQLVITSTFRLIGGGGFVLLAIGASRLQKIEEV